MNKENLVLRGKKEWYIIAQKSEETNLHPPHPPPPLQLLNVLPLPRLFSTLHTYSHPPPSLIHSSYLYRNPSFPKPNPPPTLQPYYVPNIANRPPPKQTKEKIDVLSNYI